MKKLILILAFAFVLAAANGQVSVPRSLAEIKSIASKYNAVVVFFTANFCSPCTAIAPFARAQAAVHGIPLLIVNSNVAMDTASTYRVQALPTFKVLDRNAKELLTLGGSEGEVNKAFLQAKNLK